MGKFLKMSTRLAQESIEFQRDDFGKRVEAIIEKMRKYCLEKKIRRSSSLFHETTYIQDLEHEIFDRLGLKIVFNTVGDVEDISVDVPFIFIDHIFIRQFSLDYVQTVQALPYGDLRRIPELFRKSGQIDLKNAKVSGVFSEIEHVVYMNFVMLFRITRLNNKQIVAILLHELGHVFTNFEYANRTVRTNQVLMSLGKKIKEGKPPSTFYELKELEANSKLSEKDVDRLLDSGSNMILGYRLFRTLYGRFESDTKIGIYNNTSSEQLADNFSTRFGYGRELITAMEETGRSIWADIIAENKMYRRWKIFAQYSTLHLCLTLMLGPVGLILPALTTLPISLFLFTLFKLWSLWDESGTSLKSFTYDEDKLRYKRIRDQYIEMLQQIQLPKAELSKIINDINAMDSIIAKTERSKGMFDTIKDVLFKKDKEAVSEMDLQQLIESLTHNDLILKSAEFKLQSM